MSGLRCVCMFLVLFLAASTVTAALKQPPLLIKETAATNTHIQHLLQNLQETETSGTTTTVPPATTTTVPPVTTTVPTTNYSRVTVEGLGTARGTILKSFLGRDFYAFMSLPYAKPPVGDLRFRNTEAWEGPWTQEVDGDYEATWLRPKCPQISLLFSDVISGSEDCLHLSIYTPLLPDDMPEGELLPVMFWIHGGAFTTGDASLYVPTKLMDRDVVVVVVQYRLATLGFLAGGIPEAPGNMGLLDQITALRWVQQYISNFGGDPDLVTVFGQSAGGASSSWLQLTPLTNETAPQNNGRQLFHRVIPESGSALEVWTLDSNPQESYDYMASLLNCSSLDWSSEDKVACMRTRTFQEVTWASLKIYADDRKVGGLGFRGLSPVVQEELAPPANHSLEVVVPQHPRLILQQGEFLRVPVMTGSVRDEGSLIIGLSYKDYLYPNHHYTNDTEFMRDNALSTLINAFGIDDANGAVTDTMQVAYLPHATMGVWNTMVGGMIDMGGVLFLKAGLWEVVHLINAQAPDLPIFFYSWEFEADDSLFPWIFMAMPDIPVPGGISHADELLYLFHLPGDLDERQRTMVSRMTTLWTNFAKYGNPTPDGAQGEGEKWEGDIEKWLPFSLSQPNFMLVSDNFTVQEDFLTRWNYHRDTVEPTTTLKPPTPTLQPEMVRKADYDQQVKEKKHFQIATGVLGGLAACALCVLAVLLFRKRNVKDDVRC
ncbi:juvenile hormone esterase [Procambarus clarkii]|uniref:juvenile hormone esterase n=1 Tax=Procambarus clarkii TaxID=6728 RepID=UPI0037432916